LDCLYLALLPANRPPGLKRGHAGLHHGNCQFPSAKNLLPLHRIILPEVVDLLTEYVS
jgi:hypothetical protein